MTSQLTLPAWGAGSWVSCTYWPQANRDNPQEDTPDRIFGRCAHVVAAGLLRGQSVKVDDPIEGFAGQFVTDEMLDAAMMYVRDVQQHCGGQPIYVEQTLAAVGRLEAVRIIKPDCFAWVSANRLVVWELKGGRDHVAAFSNWQLLVYVYIILETWQINGLHDQEITVDMRVIQPRNFDRDGHVRSWVVRASDLRAMFNILGNAADEATGPNPVARTGIPQCKRCPGRGKCSTFQRHAYQEASLSGDGAPFDLPGPALGLELRTLQDARAILDARITGLEEEAKAKIAKGEAVKGFTCERGHGNLVWAVPEQTIRSIGSLYGKELTKSKPITPLQAIDAGIPADVVNQYTDRPRGEPKLIRVEKSQARKAFGHN